MAPAASAGPKGTVARPAHRRAARAAAAPMTAATIIAGTTSGKPTARPAPPNSRNASASRALPCSRLPMVSSVLRAAT